MFYFRQVAVMPPKNQSAVRIVALGASFFPPLFTASAHAVDLDVAGTTNISSSQSNDRINIGVGTAATLNLSAGTLQATTANTFNINVGFSANGTLNMTGGALNGSYMALGGTNSTGTVSQSGGTVTADILEIGASTTGTGTYTVSGGTLLVNDNAFNVGIVVGFRNTGTLTISGASQVQVGTGTATTLQISSNGVTGTVNLDGGTLTTPKITSGGGNSTLNFNGGTLRARGDKADFLQGLTLAQVRNGGAIIDLNGAVITIAQSLVHSTINGDAATDGGLQLNDSAATGTSALTLTGALSYTGTTTINGGSLILGDATNSVTLPGNASLVGGNLSVANGSLGTGTITVATGQSLLVGSLAGSAATAGSSTITAAGTVTFQNSGSAGTSTINSTGVLDFADTSTAANATISLTGGAVGQLRNSASGGSATFTVGAGSSLTLGGASTLSTARLILNAGTLDISAHNAGNVVAGSIESNGDIALGANTLETGGNNRSTTYSGVVSGTGGLEKKGTGNLILTGTNAYTGNTNVSGGTLSVNGSIANSADVFVNTGGTLGGSGTVSTTVVNTGGTIAPGNSIGTLTVNGNVTFNNGSTYSVEVNSAGASDKLVVNGTVTINAGTTLAVKPFNVGETGVTYGLTTTYTLMTSTGALTGTFSNITNAFAFLDATLTYGANNVALTLKRNANALTSVTNTPNQRAAATGVNSTGSGTIYGAIIGLSAADARAAFDLLSGEIHASVETALVEDSRFAGETVNGRMIAVRRGESDVSHNVWLQGFGAYGTWAGDGNAATAQRSTGGFLIGSDGEAFDKVTAGLFAGYSRASLDVTARRSSATIDTYQVGAYGGTSLGDLAFRIMSAYSFHDIGTSRSVGFTGFSDTLTGRYQAGTGQVFGEVSYDFKPAVGTVISPFANLSYVRLDSRGFREAGGAAALSTGADSANTVFLTVGVSGRTMLDTGAMPLELSGRLGWRHAGGNVGMDRSLSFATGSVFSVGGVPVGRDTAVIDAELAFKVAPAANLSLRYSGQIGSGVSDHSFNARFDVRF
jgi:outer membrane autotransporter protein